ncbi:MAG: peptidylprolyl isomerase [Marinilabiliaceae bacterium]|nr:peptidylprolyl isomerase [Marinilabiliaceae bacterium]
MWRSLLFLSLGLLLIIMGCQDKQGKKSAQSSGNQSSFSGSYQNNVKGIVSLRTFDYYTRQLKDGYGFYVAPDLVITNLDWVKGAYKLKAAPMGTEEFSSVHGFVAYDLDRNLVLLKVSRKNPNFIQLKEADLKPDSLYQLFRTKRKLYVANGSVVDTHTTDSISYLITKDAFKMGKPVFSNAHRVAGVVQQRGKETTVLQPQWISKLLAKKSKKHKSVYDLRTKTNKVYISHTKVQGFRIITNVGNIEMTVFDETPKYRDNFIKLVSDQFYDSLLVHRVIKDFLIQTGASDTKYAKKDDVVGWKGPGYTLPMHIVPQLFHKRGMIAASKLPEDRNKRNRSDGSQFYIVSGRIFSDAELDDLESEKGIKFSQQQRQIYKTVGGAPYLDNDYTVFGQVTKGMDVVDRMAAVETYAVDRPVKEIRIKTIEILRK